ncbi:Prkab2-prov protein, related [Eimeria tenella]|uniref:Prkab2-prov protein, related n=1 Tax=Eimeria tenella TaxID=5802 RepID=U6L3D8_EIMTE|nr:Prkab2-prov protein, related [Eimeria tenella]CDJ42280.1 Prkab2-prov protein, related [Eimeria tenella]|eukprot:XP_013233030.1 Prkab2-prov protein, related [Eimeria tenella]
MGSQTSTTRQHAFSDTYRSGIPGIGPLQTGEAAAEELSLTYGPSTHGGPLGASFAASPRGDLQLYGRGPPDPKHSSDEEDLIPCVFTWTHGGHVVYLTGSFNNWSVENKFRLNRSGHEFSYIQNLKRGVHYYKFIVDDQWRYAPDQQTQTDEHGNVNNVLDISGFRHLQFKTVSEAEQARDAPYHQCVPEPSEYASDAPPIPTLLTKCAVSAVEPPPRPNFPVHCLANHLFHDSHAPHVFGPQISCVASTQRWRIDNNKPTAGQRYATYIYLTINPLYPFPVSGETAAEEAAANLPAAAAAALNPLRDFIVLPSPTPDLNPRPNPNLGFEQKPRPVSPASQGDSEKTKEETEAAADSPKRQDELSPPAAAAAAAADGAAAATAAAAAAEAPNAAA